MGQIVLKEAWLIYLPCLQFSPASVLPRISCEEERCCDSFHCQSVEICNCHRNTPLGISGKLFLEIFNLAMKTHPKCGRHHPTGSGSKTKRKQAGGQQSCVSASWLCTVWPAYAVAALTSLQRLHPHTNYPLLPEVIFIKYFVTVYQAK